MRRIAVGIGIAVWLYGRSLTDRRMQRIGRYLCCRWEFRLLENKTILPFHHILVSTGWVEEMWVQRRGIEKKINAYLQKAEASKLGNRINGCIVNPSPLSPR